MIKIGKLVLELFKFENVGGPTLDQFYTISSHCEPSKYLSVRYTGFPHIKKIKFPDFSLTKFPSFPDQKQRHFPSIAGHEGECLVIQNLAHTHVPPNTL